MSSTSHAFNDRLIPRLSVLFAGVLYAIALKYFVLPSKIILTGTEGIASSLSYYFDSDPLFIGLYLLFQSGLLIFAFLKVSRVFAIHSMIVVGTAIVLLTVLPEIQFAKPEPENERIILVIFGGILSGVAKAIAFRNRGSTGDEDILGAYFATRYLKPVGSIAVVAAIVSTSFGLLMDYLKHHQFASMVNTLMYTSIYIFISAETLNNLYRKFQVSMCVIITREEHQVSAAIQNAMPHRTYIVQSGFGGHSKAAYVMIRSIVTHEELPMLLKAIETADPNSFVYYHDLEGVSRRYYIPPIS